MDSSVYCLPADLLGEGAGRVVGTVRDRAGVSGVTVAACYHASRDILPHNPSRQKPDSGHTSTISITVRVRRPSLNAMKPRIQCVLAQWNPGSSASGRRPGSMSAASHAA